MQTKPAPVKQTFKSRILVLLEIMLEDSSMAPAYRLVIQNLVKGYIGKVNDTEIREICLKLKDEIIPWLLSNEDSDQITQPGNAGGDDGKREVRAIEVPAIESPPGNRDRS